jgi:hypothetical protein
LNIRYYIDPATELPHIHGHDVEEMEVEEVLSNPGEDRPGREGSRVATGKTSGGRYLRVIYVPDPEPNSVFVITAYTLQGKPLLVYRRRRRKRHETK